MGRPISQTKFAQKTGYSRARISQLVKQGVIILNEDGKLDFDEASAAIRSKIKRPQRLEKLSHKAVYDGVFSGGGDLKMGKISDISEIKEVILRLEALVKQILTILQKKNGGE